jgi:hypothetical protein
LTNGQNLLVKIIGNPSMLGTVSDFMSMTIFSSFYLKKMRSRSELSASDTLASSPKESGTTPQTLMASVSRS